MRVLNKHRDIIPPNATYIGRGSKWGNPFKIGIHGDRDEVIDLYEEYLLENLELLSCIDELIDKDIWCFCHPKRCHGDVLLKYVRYIME